MFLGTEGGDSLFLALQPNEEGKPTLSVAASLPSLAPIHSAFAFEDPPGELIAASCRQHWCNSSGVMQGAWASVT